MSAQLDVLTAGYAELPKVASTVVLIRDGEAVTLMTTPGHTAQDITTLATTDQGRVACTHLW